MTIAVALDEAIKGRVKLEPSGELRVVAVELHRVAARVGDCTADVDAHFGAELIGDDLDIAPLVDETRTDVHPVETTFLRDAEGVVGVDVDDREFDRFKTRARLDKAQRHDLFGKLGEAGAEPEAVDVVAHETSGAKPSDAFGELLTTRQQFGAVFFRRVRHIAFEFFDRVFDFVRVKLDRVVEFRFHMQIGDERGHRRREGSRRRIFATGDNHRREIAWRIGERRLIDEFQRFRNVVFDSASLQDDAEFVDRLLRTIKVVANFGDAFVKETIVGEGAVELGIFFFEAFAHRFKSGDASRTHVAFEIVDVGVRLVETRREELIEFREDRAKIRRR